jgi:hypothetical protein
MAQTLIRFDTPVVHRDGDRYKAQACGRERENGSWEAWLEFENIETGEVLRTQRETTQPNEKDAPYWATGLSPVYLEGALDRILNPPKTRVVELSPPPFFHGPAPKPRRRTMMSDREPILDPFSVYEKNPGALAQELTALRGWHLRQIIRDYDLVDESDVVLESLTEPELGSLIMHRMRELHP